MSPGRIALVLVALLLSSCMLSGRQDLAARGRRKARLVLDQWRRRANTWKTPIPMAASVRKKGTLHERAGRLARESDAWLADKAFPFINRDEKELIIGTPAWREKQLTRRLSAAVMRVRFKGKPAPLVLPFRKKIGKLQPAKKPETKLLLPAKEKPDKNPAELKQLKRKTDKTR